MWPLMNAVGFWLVMGLVTGGGGGVVRVSGLEAAASLYGDVAAIFVGFHYFALIVRGMMRTEALALRDIGS